ncbi:PE family protein [Mycobacterium parmense]|uniref:Uncharacterized protein n=1 Tax=Mycobacterium parmense TaxID=185642 RepID=A0A7I7YUG2_9MYCO|nr:PE family protein [Mycobacterium parmense]MCV7348869.1 PE family protein [Mycobacterium parmense]ORW53226.1 hypothetical protein AWC20_20655 [Mycobacterium parmense]BBZ44381.1 hypothetical protein MPRM_16620 [Mycobacterium parmense]
MSFVMTVPDLVQGAAQNLAGLHQSLAEAASTVAAPTTGLVPAAADEVSAAIAGMFGNYGAEFQAASAQARAFHAEFVNVLNAGAGAYLSTEVANAEQTLANVAAAPARAVFGGGASLGAAASSNPAAGLLGGLTGILGGGSGGGGTSGINGVLGGLTGGTGLGGLLGGLTGGAGGLTGLLGGLTGGAGGLTGLLGGLTGGTGLGGLLGGIGSLGGTLDSLGGGLTSLVSGALPGLPGLVTGLENQLTGIVNNLLPGLVQVNVGDVGPFFTGIAGPYEALVYNTWNNLQALGSSFLANPFPLLRQFVANQMVYGQTVLSSLQNAGQSVLANSAAFQAASQAFAAGNFAGGLVDLQTAFSGVGPALTPIATIPGHIAQNFANVVQTATNTAITPVLTLGTNPAPLSATIDNLVGLPIVAGIDLLGAPVSTIEAAGSSASAFMSAVQAGNASAAAAALIDAPAVIANGFLNGQATFPYALTLSGLTTPLGLNLSDIADLSVVANFPLDGLLVQPGYYPVTVSLDVLGGSLNGLGLGPITLNAGVGGTPFSGLLPFLINYAPDQLAIAIGAPASPPPLISIPL